MIVRVMLSIAFAMVGVMGCSVEPDPTAPPDETSEAALGPGGVTSQGSPGTWFPQSSENCSDICGGACNCIQDRCPSQPFGKPCGPVGDTCNHVVTSTVHHFICSPSPQQFLDVAISGFGAVTGTGINCPGDCFHSYFQSSNQQITATPVAGCRFDRWTGATCSPNFPNTIFSPTITLNMNIDRSCTAMFVPL
jgi:hypothetical protein